MSSTLSEGVRVPDIGSVNWGADVNFNWGLLNTALANISGNVKTGVANTWTAPQTFTETIDGMAARAVGDEDGNNIKTALASKAADADVVHKAGVETITGEKTFTADNTVAKDSSPAIRLKITNLTRGTPPSGTVTADFGVRAANGNLVSQLATQVTTNGNTCVYSRAYDGTRDQRVGIFLDATADTATYRTASNGVVDLGDSSHKWKTLNGINPGALSLPDTYINLDTTGWNLTGTSFNYAPSIDGWLFINVRPNNNYAYVAIEAAHMRNNSENTTGENAMTCIAVRKDVSAVITLVGASIAQARLVSCAGNV